MSMMCANCVPNLIARLDSLGPRNDEWIAGTTSVGLTLPAAERCVACESPAPWEVVEVFGAANFVNCREVFFNGVGNVIEELDLIQ